MNVGMNKGSYVDIACSNEPLVTLGNGSLMSKETSVDEGSVVTSISVCVSDMNTLEIIEEKFTIEHLKTKSWSVRCNPQSNTLYAIMRWALTTFCKKDQYARQRQLLIDLQPPSKPRLILTLPQILIHYSHVINSLSPAQIHAVAKAINCTDYQLILGVYSSGKSTTISVLLEILALKGYTALYMANTDARLDKTLEKLVARKVRFHHVASSREYVKKEVRKYMESYLPLERAGSREYLEAALSVNIVATTAYSLTKDVIRLREFDFCIIDNASQLPEPICLGGIVLSKRFIMFDNGDKQVSSAVNASKGEVQSLYSRLAKAHPTNVPRLCNQYVMNNGIMNFINCAVYGGLMQQGVDKQRSAALAIPRREETYVYLSL
eukprot:TRINITY_DN2833_c0_g1_i1.p1 TRINITY_DN2833_c0_g1~~TRINITY_DN2833_c0_g1_i1.p1  ORF type:complete len:379 (+),score=69.28 TRINITY_DN2833_c0_g1_i1:306-1442(+)